MIRRPFATVLRPLLAVVTLLTGAVTAHAQSFVNFESGHVRPLALAPAGDLLFAVNTPDNRLAVYTVDAGGLTLAVEVSVGLEPVAVAARTNLAGHIEAWVVNHLSDSVSVVDVDPANLALARVTRTLLVGDEPRDIVFAGSAGNRAFITAAHRGQNRPGDPQFTTPGIGRADVWTFNADNPGGGLGGTPLSIVTLFGDTPRALTKSPSGATVYAAVFHSGNRTTTITQGAVCNGGAGAPPCGKACAAGANRGAACSNASECPASACLDRSPGGLPAPNATDGGAAQPEVGLIVKFDGTHWLDEIGRSWDLAVNFALPDQDVFLINADANPPALAPGANAVAGVGTVLFNMATRPNGKVYVANTDAQNEVRFEPVVNGHLAESRITIINGTTPTAVHLNPHINYAVVPGTPAEAAQSLAFPTDMVFSSDGATLYVAAFGSGKVGVLDAGDLEAGTVTEDQIQVGGGPSGLALDEAHDRLYVMNRFDHTISIVSDVGNPALRAVSATLPLRFDPSPAAVRNGRRFLYDALFTSSHGDSACASCHIFGDFDSLAWDLGNPFGDPVPNPNPFRIGSGGPFHPMKGPMTTQTLRGMAPNGPMHWRGDRTGGTTGGDPLDEDLAFKAFNPAFVGLLGRSTPLLPAEMQAFTDFILTVRYPPNPIHMLDNSQTTPQTDGQTFFLNNLTDAGVVRCQTCHALPLGADGFSSVEGETQEFKIAHFRNLYQKVGMFGLPPGIGLNKFLGNQIRGFGFLHDGSVPTIFNFVSSPVFQNLNDTLRRDLEDFLLAFDTGLRPSVGQQVLLGPAPLSTPAANRLDLLIARANAGDCDLTMKGIVNGVPRGARYVGNGQFQTDRDADALISKATAESFATTAGQEQVFTCVPPGSGHRIGIDRDGDGFGDRTEIEAGSDPANPASVPGATGVMALIRTTSLSLKDRSAPPPDPSKRKLSFKASTKDDAPANQVVPPPVSSSGDPTAAGATGGGATVIVYDSSGSGEKVEIFLPAAGWSASTSASGAPSYRFRGVDGDPLSHVDVKENSVKIRGGKAAFGYTLDEPSQGSIAVRLTLGTTALWCADAPAKASGNPPSTARNDHVDKFVAQSKTPPPTVCPPVP